MAPLFPQTGISPNIRNPFGNLYQNNQPPAMSINIPTMLQQPTTPNPILVGVHGLDSVKQYPFGPNQTLAFHDLDADFEYVVNTDVNSQPAFKILEFNQITEEEYREKYSKMVNNGTVVLTTEEYDTLVKRVEKLEMEVNANAQQPIRYPKSASGNNASATAAKPATRSTDIRDAAEVKPERQP